MVLRCSPPTPLCFDFHLLIGVLIAAPLVCLGVYAGQVRHVVPLILGHDVLRGDVNAKVWPIVANTEAVAINQAWAGHPGFLAAQSDPTVSSYQVQEHKFKWNAAMLVATFLP
jgi:hypothetical protein